jgi:hypothetical protein
VARRGGPRRTGPGCGHPRIGVPGLSAPRGCQRRARAHRPVRRAAAVDPASRRPGGTPGVAAASRRERGRGLPRGHRGDRRERNADQAARRRPAGRGIADPEGSRARRRRLPDPRGHRDAGRRRFDDSRREPEPDHADRRRVASARPATDRPTASCWWTDTPDSHADTAADANTDGHTEREPVASDQRDTVTEPEPVTPALAVNQPEPVMRRRMRALNSTSVRAMLVRVLRSWGFKR